jgi:predicted Zn-dependent protease
VGRKRWTVDLEDAVHTVEFSDGYWTGKRTIQVDGLPIVQERKFLRLQPFDTPFNLVGHNCAIRTSTNGFTYSYDLIVDGRSLATGSVARPPSPIPKWTWLFIIACGALIGVGGLIGGLIGGLGAIGCGRIARDRELGPILRPVLCGMVTTLAWGSYAVLSVLLLSGGTLLGFGAASSFTPVPVTSLHGSGHVYFVPLGRFPAATLDALTGYYRDKYGLSITVLSPVAIPSGARDAGRDQLIAEDAITLMQTNYPELTRDTSAILIGLTTDDMFIRHYNWKFAFSYREDSRFTVVATSRMRIGVSFDNEALWEDRLRKMVTKDIGVLYFHLPLSDNPHSVLYNNVGGLEELDTMGEDF